MKYILRFLYPYFRTKNVLGGSGFVPLPKWVKIYLQYTYKKKSQQIFIIAKLFVGYDLSRIADNSVACAESVSRIINEVISDFSVVTGTYTLNELLSKDRRFKRIQIHEALSGDIIVSPTGFGANPNMPNGHAGIIGESKCIYSNDSMTGKWSKNYTITSWANRYKYSGGYPLNVFRII